MKTILVVDDEASIRLSLQGALEDEGYRVLVAENGVQALETLERESIDVALLDIWMPGMDGLSALSEIKKRSPQLSVVMMSGHGNIETAVRATKLGAYDFIEKPLSLEKLLVILKNAIQSKLLSTENTLLRDEVSKKRAIIGKSQATMQLRELVKRVAPAPSSVLITGENGTGKELIAHALHQYSPRYQKPFIAMNCAAIPEELIESELFGHEKGAFTGATKLKRGKFDLAHEGTLFLDEIGDMSLKTQAKVLRVLQDQKFERVGGGETHSVDVRVVAATNKDLKSEIQKGNFREDLFYRLHVIRIHSAPLRERKEDILSLAEHFMLEASARFEKKPRSFSKEALSLMLSYPWPGNVRELKNLVDRILVLTLEEEDGSSILGSHIQEHLFIDSEQENIFMNDSAADLALEQLDQASAHITNLRDARTEFEKDFISRALQENEGNVSKTAQVLGVERSHLHKKMKSLGIES